MRDERQKENAAFASAMWHERHPGRGGEFNRTWRHKNPAKFILNTIRGRAKAKGWEFDLTLEQVEALLEPMRCALTGLPLRWTQATHDPWAPSLDRRDNSKGYTLDNVRVVAYRVNLMRREMTDDEFLAIAHALIDTMEVK